MTALVACFGVALASAFLPFIPIEAYLGAAVSESSQTWWALAVAATLGQMLGKIAIFLIGRLPTSGPMATGRAGGGAV